MYHWTKHAQERWNERFKGIDCNIELAHATTVGKGIKKKIRRLAPTMSKRYMRSKFQGQYWLIGRSNIVFAIDASTHSILTVFHLMGLPEDNRLKEE